MPEIRIAVAVWPEDLEAARVLLRNYQRHLLGSPGGAAAICLTGYEAELEELASRWGGPKAALLLARLDSAPAGCVAVRMLADRPGSAEMKRMWVEPTARGHRLGRRLAEASIEWARQHDARELLLDTVPAAMPEANRLYAELGFQPYVRYNDNDVSDVVFFRLQLD